MEGLEFLGQKVRVEIDRPMNSLHPKFGYKYEVNYGFIPDTIAGDGKEIDAYVLGITEPLLTFEGIVKGIIQRHNDNENKLIVCTEEYILTKKEIKEKTHFQEQYFKTTILLF